MPTYLSPGVYVEEIASGSAPIASLGTSTAGFIGVVGNEINIPISPFMQVADTFEGDETKQTFNLTKFPVNGEAKAQILVIDPASGTSTFSEVIPIVDTTPLKKATVNLDSAPAIYSTVRITYIIEAEGVEQELVKNYGLGVAITNSSISYPLTKFPVKIEEGTWTVWVNDNNDLITSDDVIFTVDREAELCTIDINTDKIKNDQNLYESNQTKVSIDIKIDYLVELFPTFYLPSECEVKLCTNFNEFRKYFGDFSTDPNHQNLVHAVYGFFNNGGSRCYVSRVADIANITGVLEKFEAIDEIAIVAAPGITDPDPRNAIETHCQKMGDRFAILDCKPKIPSNEIVTEDNLSDCNYAAYYFPWIKVSDPAKKMINPNAKGEDTYLNVPPSGHIAGVYARVDAQRGVHKAPANEVIFGALGLEYKISKNQQDGLNPLGINCIRDLNGNIRIWGARTVGGDANGEFKYINVRRLFLSIKDSIEEGTQWTVFEPNDMELWAKIRRNVNAYLTNVWRSGALFGATPQEAFFVKCDAENNPPEVRDLGQVIIEIGVAPVKPAEFVIFRISQWAGSGG